MALAVDSQEATSAGHGVTGSGSLSWSFTNTAGTLLIVGVVAAVTTAGTPPATTTAVTYGGVSMTKVSTTITWDGASHNRCEASLWTLLSPATGSNTVAVTATVTDTGGQSVVAGAISFTGNDGSTPLGTPASAKNDSGAGSTSASVTVSGTTSGNIVVAVMGTGSGYSSTSNTLSWSKNQSGFSAGGNAALTRQAVSTGSTAMTDTVTQDFWGILAAEVKAAAVGGGQDTPELYGRPYGSHGQFQMQQLLAQ